MLCVELLGSVSRPQQRSSASMNLEAMLFNRLKYCALMLRLVGEVRLYDCKRDALLAGSSQRAAELDVMMASRTACNLAAVALLRRCCTARAWGARVRRAALHSMAAAAHSADDETSLVCFPLRAPAPLVRPADAMSHDSFSSAEREEARLQRSLSRVRIHYSAALARFSG